MTPKVMIIDYGIGNVFSVIHALNRLGVKATLTSNSTDIMSADYVILPGVGAFGRAADKLREMQLDGIICEYVATGKPFLGICVGMQLLMDSSEEFGNHKGLGLIPGTVRKVAAREDNGVFCRVPLIGWMPVIEARPGAWNGTPLSHVGNDNAFYFVHSFHAVVNNPAHCIAVHRLGDSDLTSAVRRENVLGVQFHPERSDAAGHRFLSGFLGIDCASD